MRLPVLIQYTVQHAQPGGRVRNRPAFEIVEFEVATATTDEAPIAVRWNDMPYPEQVEGWGCWNENGDGHTRWFGDRHWTPLLDTRETNQGPLCGLDFDTLAEICRSAKPIVSFLGNWTLKNSAPPTHRPDDCPPDVLRRVVDDTRSTAINATKEALSKLLFIDGAAYEACHEPRLVMIQAIYAAANRTRSMRIVTDALHIRLAISDDPDQVAPVTRFDDLHDMNRLFDRAGITKFDETRRPVVEAWESIDEDAHWDQVTNARITRFLSDHSNVTLGQMTPEQFAAVKDAMDTKVIGDRDERLEAYERVLRNLSDAWPDYRCADSLKELAAVLGGRDINVPLQMATGRRIAP